MTKHDSFCGCVYAIDPPIHEQDKHICRGCGFETTDIFELLDHYESYM